MKACRILHLGLVFMLPALGCVSQQALQWTAQVIDAERDIAYHRFEAGLKKLKGLFPKAPSPTEKGFIVYKIGYAYYQKGDYPRALDYFCRVERYPNPEYSARSLFYSARIYYQTAGDKKRALRLLQKVMFQYYRFSIAARALRTALKWLKEERPLSERLPVLRAWEKKISPASDLSGDILFYLGLLHLQLQRPVEAHLYLMKLIARYPRNSMTIKAIELIGNQYQQQGRYREEVDFYQWAFNRVGGKSVLFPAYNPYDKLWFRVPLLYFSKIKDFARSVKALKAFIAEFGESRYLERAYYMLIVSLRALNKAKAAQSYLKLLAVKFPGSPFLNSLK